MSQSLSIRVSQQGCNWLTKIAMVDIDCRGGTNRGFGKPCVCPLPKRGRFDENGENDKFAVCPQKLSGVIRANRFARFARITLGNSSDLCESA